ncbi:MAG TPA: cell division protein FtsL [Acidimicrobiales bacterium]|jgi:cell division protein FtsL
MATVQAPRRVAVSSRGGHTAAAAATTAPAGPLRAPQRDPQRDVEPRPSLRVVRDANHRIRYGLLVTIGIGAVFAVLLGLVMFHTVLLQNQRKLDQLDSQVRDEQARYQQLRLQVAQLQAPQRIIDVATTKIGLVPSSGTTYLTPSGADAAAARQAQATTTDTTPSDDTAPSVDHAGEAPSSDSGWPQVKPYLGATP